MVSDYRVAHSVFLFFFPNKIVSEISHKYLLCYLPILGDVLNGYIMVNHADNRRMAHL